MTITKGDIQNLANLARMEISETEAESLVSEIDPVLAYIGQIKSSVGGIEQKIPELHNVMRDDVSTNVAGQYTDKILSNAPSKEKGYFKVKKIL